MLWTDVPYPDTVEQLERALREQPVIVHETMGGGDTAEALERIGRLVSELPFRAYVAVVETPDDVDAGIEAGRYLATALSRRIGEPGLYVVDGPDSVLGVRMVGTGWDETIFSLQTSTNQEAVGRSAGTTVLSPTVDVETVLETALASPPQPSGSEYDEVTLADEVIEDLAERDRSLQPYERPGLDDEDAPPEPWSTGKRWMVGTSVAIVTLLVLLQTLRGWPGWRRRRPEGSGTRSAPGRPATSDVDALRADATAQLTALAETLPVAPQGDLHERAALAREVAEHLLDSDDLLDVAGALVLARGGRRELAIALGRARTPYRVCFFDPPRHPTASQTVEWRFGDSVVQVPVCRTCRRDIKADRVPETLTVRRVGGSRPYYETDTVWARTGFGSLSTDLAELARQVAAERQRR